MLGAQGNGVRRNLQVEFPVRRKHLLQELERLVAQGSLISKPSKSKYAQKHKLLDCFPPKKRTSEGVENAVLTQKSACPLASEEYRSDGEAK